LALNTQIIVKFQVKL